MINVILKAMHKCGDFNNADAQCTMAGLELTKASAGTVLPPQMLRSIARTAILQQIP